VHWGMHPSGPQLTTSLETVCGTRRQDKGHKCHVAFHMQLLYSQYSPHTFLTEVPSSTSNPTCSEECLPLGWYAMWIL
jgi:hypothetical protein